MATRDRKAATDRLIEAALRHPAPGAPRDGSASCPDPELVAAYVERRLEPDEVERLEAHMAGCERCQETLATLVRALPVLEPAPEPARGWWDWLSSPWSWAVPASVVAALLAVWIAGRQPAVVPPQPEATVAEVLPPADRSEREIAAGADRSDESQAPADLEGRSSIAAKGAGAPDAEANRQKLETFGHVELTREAPAPAPPPPPQPEPAAPASAAPVVADRAEADAVASAEQKAVVPPPLPTRRAQETGLRALAPRASEIVAPDGTARWRFGFGGMLFKSADAMTWDRQETGTTLDLLSGSAVSASTCWVVGREGLVLVTTDGDTWQRVPFPETVDLVEVVAHDAGSATVTASDGRRFGTTDAGRTWTLLP